MAAGPVVKILAFADDGALRDAKQQQAVERLGQGLVKTLAKLAADTPCAFTR